MRTKIVLVRPLGEENVGLCARACANFGAKEIALVKPECNWKSGKAKSRAMHGKQLLLKAKEYNSVAEAAADCAYAIATSARKGKGRNAFTPLEISQRFSKSRAKIALVFGPEPSGLSNSEIGECDFIASIPASRAYPALNLSHAVAVMLYQLFNATQAAGFEEAEASDKKALLRLFSEGLSLLPGIDDRKQVLASFKALAGRALLSKKEARSLIAFLSEAGKELGKKRKG